jgi:hypothetical protein
MPDTIRSGNKTYFHHSEMVPKDGSPSPLRDQSEDRKSFSPDKENMKLANTAGAYFTVGAKDILLVIDKDTVPPGSEEWELIAKTVAHLETCYPRLSEQAWKALSQLRAVVFSKKPERSFAEVRPDIFIYDADELRRKDGSLNHPAWIASCIVHDANHIWQHDNGRKWTGQEAESECWQLQVDTGPALGLTAVDIDHLKGFIANPSKIDERANADPFKPKPQPNG